MPGVLLRLVTMYKHILALLTAGFTLGASAAQLEFDFGKDTVGQTPPEFASLVTGSGEPAQWKVAEESVPPLLAPLESNSVPNLAQRSVLSVHSLNLSQDHCPILLFTNEIFDDFNLTTRFKISGGVVEPSAGLIFRAQDQSNYYVVRACTEGNLLWYRVVGGKSYQNLGIGVKIPIAENAWRELRVECRGSQMRCYLDGNLAIPPATPGAPTNDLAINDTTFSRGKIGYWTEADSKCSFVDTVVRYEPRVPYVQVVIENVLKKHPKLLGLKVYASKNAGQPTVIGSMDAKDLGTPGTRTDADAIEHGSIYYLKVDGTVEVTLPLRDRNGDIVAAVRVKMKSFKGETQATAVTRASIVKKAVEEQIETLQGLNG
jgi:hypothetical protein